MENKKVEVIVVGHLSDEGRIPREILARIHEQIGHENIEFITVDQANERGYDLDNVDAVITRRPEPPRMIIPIIPRDDIYEDKIFSEMRKVTKDQRQQDKYRERYFKRH